MNNGHQRLKLRAHYYYTDYRNFKDKIQEEDIYE